MSIETTVIVSIAGFLLGGMLALDKRIKKLERATEAHSTPSDSASGKGEGK